MRYLGGFVFVLTLAVLPLSVSAQDEGATAQTGVPGTGRPDLSGERHGYQPPRAQRASRTADMDTLELMQLRVKRARIGVFTSGGVAFVGFVLFGVGAANACFLPTPEEEAFCEDWGGVLLGTGAALAWGGIVGLITSGGIMAHRKRKLRKQKRELWESPYSHHGTPRRVQWDLARSRVVF